MTQIDFNPVNVLRRVPLFAALTEEELSALAAGVKSRTYEANQLLFSEGEPCEGLSVVVSGRIRIFKLSPNGREQVLSVSGPDSSIAELPIFDGGGYPASAVAVESSEVLFVSRKHFRSFCLEHPEVLFKVLEVVGGRLRRLVGIIEELSFTTVRQRLAAYLLKKAEAEGRPMGRGVAFAMDGSHQEIAAEIGTVRELVSRNLARFHSQGLIETRGREMTITDVEGLAAEQMASL
ncbi:MAG TPA: Crp/Fnr family transcriptional regulator [Bryobacteraceae bacterium]|nr:Crp/Fnr family transcriptional regulator [Bryobacteraceae bacterium]